MIHAGHPRITGGGEIPCIGIIGAFAIFHLVHQFGDDAIQVHVALSVGMGGHVHLDAVHPGGKVGAMVQVEATQEILVSLA